MNSSRVFRTVGFGNPALWCQHAEGVVTCCSPVAAFLLGMSVDMAKHLGRSERCLSSRSCSRFVFLF